MERICLIDIIGTIGYNMAYFYIFKIVFFNYFATIKCLDCIGHFIKILTDKIWKNVKRSSVPFFSLPCKVSTIWADFIWLIFGIIIFSQYFFHILGPPVLLNTIRPLSPKGRRSPLALFAACGQPSWVQVQVLRACPFVIAVTCATTENTDGTALMITMMPMTKVPCLALGSRAREI